MDKSVETVCVKTFLTRPEAEVAKSVLDANGIECFVLADDEGGMSPFPMRASTTGVGLFVRKADVMNAKNLLGK